MIKTKDEFFQQLRAQPTDVKKQEFLENSLKENLIPEVRIATLSSIAEFYIKKGWFGIAAKHYCDAGDLASIFKEKMDLYFKGALMHLNARNYIEAENNFKKVIILSANQDKEKIKEKISKLYKEHAESFEKTNQYSKAISAFSKVLLLNLPKDELNSIYDKLAVLYDKIGQPRDANRMRNQKLK